LTQSNIKKGRYWDVALKFLEAWLAEGRHSRSWIRV
jgi:hypothetical protein